MKKLLAVAALSVALLPAVSFGDTVWSGYIPFSIKSGVVTLTLPQFNPVYGSLDWVEIDLKLSKTGGSVEADNDASTGGLFTISQTVTATLASSDVKLLDANLDPVVATLSIMSTSPTITFAPTTGDATDQFDRTLLGDYATYAPADGNTEGYGTVSSLLWYAGTKGYIGTGTFDVSVTVAQDTSDTSSGAINYAVVPSDVSGLVAVIYSFTPVPEPTTWAMLMGGAGLLTLGRRMRRLKA